MIFFLYVPDSSPIWFSKSCAKTVAKTQYVGKRPPYSCIKEELSQRKAGLLSPTASNCSSCLFSAIQIDLFLSRDGVDAIGLCEKEED